MKATQSISVLPENGVLVIKEGTMNRLFFDFTPHVSVNEEENPSNLYDCQNVDVQGSSYEAIVNAIMVDKYQSDKVQAVLLNYQDACDAGSDITDEKRAEYIAEYNNMQSFRKYAKTIAHTVTD